MAREADPITDQRLRTFVVACLAISVTATAVAGLTSHAADWEPLALVFVLAAFSVVGEAWAPRRRTDALPPWGASSPAALVLAMTLLGPAPALAIGAAGVTASAIRNRTPALTLIANLANYGAFTVIGGLAARWAIESWSLTPDEAGFVLLVIGLAYFVEVFSSMFSAVHARVVFGSSIRSQVDWEQGFLLGAALPTALLTAVVAFLYEELGIAAMALLILVETIHQDLHRRLVLSQERAFALESQAQRLTQLSEARGRLVGQVLRAEDRERRRLAEALHGDPLQDVCFARSRFPWRSDLDAERARAALDHAITELRGTISDLHPASLESGGLRAALDEVADNQSERSGIRVEIEVDDAACGSHDQLLFVLGREQITNAAKHSAASEVTLAIAHDDGSIVMDVADDGRGMRAERLQEAREQGHVGLASSEERVEALGGRMEIDSAPGRGTRIRTTLPPREHE